MLIDLYNKISTRTCEGFCRISSGFQKFKCRPLTFCFFLCCCYCTRPMTVCKPGTLKTLTFCRICQYMAQLRFFPDCKNDRIIINIFFRLTRRFSLLVNPLDHDKATLKQGLSNRILFPAYQTGFSAVFTGAWKSHLTPLSFEHWILMIKFIRYYKNKVHS